MPQYTEEIEHGYKVQDSISGFTGIVTLIGEHISGCTRIGVYPVGEEQAVQRGEQEFFYEEQLEVLDNDTEYTEYDVQTDTEFDLGDVVVDELTGYSGVVGVVNYKLWNCPSLSVYSTSDNEVETEWFDSVMLREAEATGVDVESLTEEEETATTGALQDRSPRNNRS
jgi:hypothetical protein